MLELFKVIWVILFNRLASCFLALANTVTSFQGVSSLKDIPDPGLRDKAEKFLFNIRVTFYTILVLLLPIIIYEIFLMLGMKDFMCPGSETVGINFIFSQKTLLGAIVGSAFVYFMKVVFSFLVVVFIAVICAFFYHTWDGIRDLCKK